MPVLQGAEPFARDADAPTGARTGVLLCHGFTGTPQSLRPWARHLAAAGFSVRVPRLPGHGTTWQAMARTDWQDWYRRVERSLDDLVRSCDVVVVGGLSMGGSLALRLAQQHPRDVAGLMLVNPSVQREPRMAALPVLRWLTPSIAGIGSDIAAPGGHELAYRRTPLHAAHSMTRLWRGVRRDLPEVTQPLLLHRSSQDHVVPPANSATVLAGVSSVDVTEVICDDSFHVLTLDHGAARLHRDSVAFVTRVAAAQRAARTDRASADVDLTRTDAVRS